MIGSQMLEANETRQSFVIDCHAHALPQNVLSPFRHWLEETGTQEEGPPQLWSAPEFGDLDGQIASMNRTGICAAVLTHSSSAPAALHSAAVATGKSANETIRDTNEELRFWELESGDRLLATAWVDPRMIDSALEEIETVANSPFTRAASVLTAYQDSDGRLRFLDHPDFEPVLALASELGVPLMVHAGTKFNLAGFGEPSLPGKVSPYVTGGLSMLVENTLCLVRLVVGGALDRHPDLRLLFGQLGGIFPFIAGRFDLIRSLLAGAQASTGDNLSDNGRSAGLLKNLRDYSNQIYVDTHSMDRPAVECALELLGPHRIVFGSDFPVTPEHLGRASGTTVIEELGLSPEERDAILGVTAAGLFEVPVGVLR